MGGTNLLVRSEIVALAQHGLTDQQIAKQVDLSPFTVRKWRRRFKQLGKSGLTPPMGRPTRGILSRFVAPIVAQLSI